MESGDRILVAAGLTAAVVVGAFVLWGPGGAPTVRKRRGQIAGLHNLGRTCFLNTLLQALASCPHFITWLQKYSKAGTNNSMITTLYTVLEVVNGTHASVRGTPVCPLGVLNCLKSLGWVIPEDQQDAHELLHVLLSCVEEETQAMVKKPGCLSDALGLSLAVRPSELSPPPARAESSPATPSTTLPRRSSAAALAPTSNMFTSTAEPDFVDDAGDDDILAHYPTRVLQKGVSRSFCHLNQMGRGWGTAAVPLQPPPLPPFHGTMATRLQCTVCSNKTPIRYDKFDSISLPLGADAGAAGALSVPGLLRAFTAPELVRGVKCGRCAANVSTSNLHGDGQAQTTHIKTLSFGKIPSCLCLHIARTQWTGVGLSKRMEHITFSETLSLAPYTASQPPQVDLKLVLRSPRPPPPPSAPCGEDGERALYRLCGVVVHVGGPRSGHFVTYRRGNGFEANRWFYTSDAIVHEVTFQEVLCSSAYMLFYERSGPSMRQSSHLRSISSLLKE